MSTARNMIANFDAQVFVPLADNLASVNVSQLRSTLIEKGVSISYPRLLDLMRGKLEKVNGYELVKVENIPATHFLPATRPVMNKDTDKVPVPVEKDSTTFKTLNLLKEGITLKELHRRFPSNKSDVQLLGDLQYYADNFGYELFYNNQEKFVQLVLPTGISEVVVK